MSSLTAPGARASLAGSSPDPRRSTSDRRSEVLRGGSGQAPVGLRRDWRHKSECRMENEECRIKKSGSAMFVMGNSFESGLNRDCNDTRKTISAAFGAGRSVASEVRGLRGAGEQGCDSHRGEAATVGQPKVPAL